MKIEKEIYWLDEKKKILQFLIENDFEINEHNSSVNVYEKHSDRVGIISSISFYNQIDPEERDGFFGYVTTNDLISFEFCRLKSNHIEAMICGVNELFSNPHKIKKYLDGPFSYFSFVEDDFCTRILSIFSMNYSITGVPIYDKNDSKHKLILPSIHTSSSRANIRNVLSGKIDTVFVDEVSIDTLFPRFFVEKNGFPHKKPIAELIRSIET